MNQKNIESPLIGDKINHLTVVYIHKTGACDCRCDCGNVVRAITRHRFWTPDDPSRAHNKTCGRRCPYFIEALRARRHKHGDSPKDRENRHPFYEAWGRIKKRCHNEIDQNYDRYGAVGIRVDDAWRKSYLLFLAECHAFPNPDVFPEAYNLESESIVQSARNFYTWAKQNYADKPEDWTPSAAVVREWGALVGKDRAWLQHWSVDRILNVLPDGSPGCYVPGNTRLLPPTYQAVNRTNTLMFQGQPVVNLARAAGVPIKTATARYRKEDPDPFRPVRNPANEAIDRALAELVTTGRWYVHEDGRIVDTVRNAPIAPFLTSDKRYLVVKLPHSAVKISHHRAVAIAHHGLANLRRWYPHHISQHKYDNRAENIRWMSGRAHTKVHAMLINPTADEIQISKATWLAYYQNRANYEELLVRHVRVPVGYKPFEPVRILDDKSVEDLLAHHQVADGTCPVISDNPDVLRALIAAPCNGAEKAPDGLTMLVRYPKCGREVRIPLSKLAKTHYLYWACIDCGYQSDKRKELRFQFADRDSRGTVNYFCEWCASVAIKNPLVAQLLVEFGVDGISPFRLGYNHPERKDFYCRNSVREIDPCESPPLNRIVRGTVKHQGPICERCRALIRPENLKIDELV